MNVQPWGINMKFSKIPHSNVQMNQRKETRLCPLYFTFILCIKPVFYFNTEWILNAKLTLLWRFSDDGNNNALPSLSLIFRLSLSRNSRLTWKQVTRLGLSSLSAPLPPPIYEQPMARTRSPYIRQGQWPTVVISFIVLWQLKQERQTT
jgi:hypothetical protein